MAYVNLIDLIYPTGSIYQTTSSTNPQTLFGGSWSRITDRFLIGCGNTYSNGGMGGKTTHTLTINEMPEHNHKVYGGWGEGSYDGSSFRTDSNSPAHWWSATGDNGGGSAQQYATLPWRQYLEETLLKIYRRRSFKRVKVVLPRILSLL